jgi:hypothetical protein
MVPEPCGDPDPTSTTTDACGVRLGQPCAADGDCCDDAHPGCSNAFCLHQTNLSWPGGYCSITEPPPDGCRPGAGVFYHITNDACGVVPGAFMMQSPTIGFYLRSCRQDSDCAPRTFKNGLVEFGATAWACDAGLHACRPTSTGATHVAVPMPGVFPISVEPFCIRDTVRCGMKP